jgi:c-di-GMP-binding flagellar brake protein YcgR
VSESSERRRFERLPKPYRLEVSAFRFPLAGQKRVEAHCRDISAGGVKMSCSLHFEAGEKILVKVFIPSLNKFHPGYLKVFESDEGQYLQAIAEVMWAEQSGAGEHMLGVRFVDVDQDDWKALENLLRKMLNEREEG